MFPGLYNVVLLRGRSERKISFLSGVDPTRVLSPQLGWQEVFWLAPSCGARRWDADAPRNQFTAVPKRVSVLTGGIDPLWGLGRFRYPLFLYSFPNIQQHRLEVPSCVLLNNFHFHTILDSYPLKFSTYTLPTRPRPLRHILCSLPQRCCSRWRKTSYTILITSFPIPPLILLVSSQPLMTASRSSRGAMV